LIERVVVLYARALGQPEVGAISYPADSNCDDGLVGSRPPRTPDGRFVVIDGRKWRATDPSLPEARRKKLVEELMAARRAVGAAKRAGDADAEGAARQRVHAAKTKLGERGQPWWER
jgi:uncharacterized protein